VICHEDAGGDAVCADDKRGDFPMPQPPLANLKGVFDNLRFALP